MALKEFKEDFGFKINRNWVLPGAVLLEMVGQSVVRLEVKVEEETNIPHLLSSKQYFIKGFKDFRSSDLTYEMTAVCLETPDAEEEVYRISSEGFSLGSGNNPEKSNISYNFIPNSYNVLLQERSFFQGRLIDIMDNGKGLGVEEIKELAGSELAKTETLRHFKNIGLILKTEDGEIHWMRVKGIGFRHDHKTTYNLTLNPHQVKGSLVTKIETKDMESGFEIKVGGEVYGNAKLVDLSLV